MRPSLSPTYSIARTLCITACMWSPVIVLLGICIMAGSSVSHRMEAQSSEAFVSYRTANGGQP